MLLLGESGVNRVVRDAVVCLAYREVPVNLGMIMSPRELEEISSTTLKDLPVHGCKFCIPSRASEPASYCQHFNNLEHESCMLAVGSWRPRLRS